MPPSRLTPNQIVAWNLERARALRSWTQQEAAEHLEPYLGERWSKATFSSAERSVTGARIRQFTADDLYAFARGFDVPLTYFLCPPPWGDEIGHASSNEASSAWDYLDVLFDVREDGWEWLVRRVVPMTAQTTLMLRRWRKNFTAMIDRRQREVDELLATREES